MQEPTLVILIPTKKEHLQRLKTVISTTKMRFLMPNSTTETFQFPIYSRNTDTVRQKSTKTSDTARKQHQTQIKDCHKHHYNDICYEQINNEKVLCPV